MKDDVVKVCLNLPKLLFETNLRSKFFHYSFTEPAYQSQPGTLYYPTNQPDSRAQSIIYPTYAPPNLGIPIHPGYHVEITPQSAPPTIASTVTTTAPPAVSCGLDNSNIAIHYKSKDNMSKYVQQVTQQQPQQTQQSHPSSSSNQQHKPEPKPMPQAAQIYHINLDQPSMQAAVVQQQQQVQKMQSQQSQSHKPHIPQPISMEKLAERAYHLEKQQQQQGQPPSHLSEAIYRMPPMSSGILTMSPQAQVGLVACNLFVDCHTSFLPNFLRFHVI